MTAPTTHRGRRAKAEAARQRAVEVIERKMPRYDRDEHARPFWAAVILEALEAAGLRIVEMKPRP
jgi:hypothetical protein